MSEELWDTKRVAEYLKVHPRTVERWRDAGKLTAAHLGRRWRYDPADVRRFVEQN